VNTSQSSAQNPITNARGAVDATRVAIASTPQTAALAAPVFANAITLSVDAFASRAFNCDCSSSESGRSIRVIMRRQARARHAKRARET